MHLIGVPILSSIADHIAAKPLNFDKTNLDSLRKAEKISEKNIALLRKDKMKTAFIYQAFSKKVFGPQSEDANRLESLKEQQRDLTLKIEACIKVQEKYTEYRLLDKETSLANPSVGN